MATDARVVRLGDVIELQRGFDLPTHARTAGVFPVVSSSGISGTHMEPRVKGPGVVTGRYGTLGAVYFIPGDFWPLNTTLFVRDFKGNDPLFVSYLLRTLDVSIYSDKAAVPGVNRNHLHEITVRIPPVEEQRRIAAILRPVDEKIELNQQLSKTLEETARAIYESWFVDFDPVRAKSTGRPTGLPQSLSSLFPDSLRESELGPIPEDWRIEPVGNLADVVGGTTPRTGVASYWASGTHHWATPKDLSRLTFPVVIDTERLITDEGLSQIGSGLLPIGTVLLSSRAPIGYLAITEIPVAINQGFIAMSPKGLVSNLFLYFWASASRDAIVSRANGSTFLEISKASFRPIPVVVPTTLIARAFDELVQPMYRRLVAYAREAVALEGVRDQLLRKLVSGDVLVPEP